MFKRKEEGNLNRFLIQYVLKYCVDIYIKNMFDLDRKLKWNIE